MYILTEISQVHLKNEDLIATYNYLPNTHSIKCEMLGIMHNPEKISTTLN